MHIYSKKKKKTQYKYIREQLVYAGQPRSLIICGMFQLLVNVASSNCMCTLSLEIKQHSVLLPYNLEVTVCTTEALNSKYEVLNSVRIPYCYELDI